MKEQIFSELGFEKIIVPAEQSGSPQDWYYYALDIGGIALVTSSSDEIKDDNWYCYLFEEDSFKITNETDLVDLVNLFNKIHINTNA